MPPFAALLAIPVAELFGYESPGLGTMDLHQAAQLLVLLLK